MPSAAEFLDAPPEERNALLSAEAFLDESIIPGAEIKTAPTFTSELSAGRIGNAAAIAYENVRREFSGVMGPTEREKSEEAIAWGKNPDGSTHYEYRPLGNRMEREAGLLTSPFVSAETFLEPAPNDSQLAKIGKAVYNSTAGLVGSLANPGTAVLGLIGAGSPVLAKVASGAFGLDMAAHLPDAWAAVKEAEKTPAGSQERMEAGLNAFTQLVMTHAALRHATARRPAQPNAADFLDIAPEEPVPLSAAAAPPVAGNLKQTPLKSFSELPVDLPVAVPFLDDPAIPFMTKVRWQETAREMGMADEQITPLTARQISELYQKAMAQTKTDTGLRKPETKTTEPTTPSEKRASARPTSEGDIARAEYERELLSEANASQAETGHELLEAIVKSGGLPTRNAAAREAFAGEMKRIDETARNPQRTERIALNKLFRADAPALDDLTTSLRDRGFDLATPNDLLNAVEQRLRTGSEVYGNAAIANVDAHLRPNIEILRLLNDPLSQTGPQMRAPTATEGGALFSRGGARTPLAIKGVTPRGDTEFLTIEPAWKRLFQGLEREGAADVIGRTRNKVGQLLATATKRHVDTEQELFGQFSSRIQKEVRGQPKQVVSDAFDELSGYIAAKENNRALPAVSPLAQRILKSWEEIADQTGLLAAAHNVQVFDPALGAHRPMHRIGRTYIPRMFRRDVEQVMRAPERNPVLWNDLVTALAKHRGIPDTDAATLLRSEAGRFTANDFMGNLEMARRTPLPEIFYEYDLRQLASRYIPNFSERMAQIISYGQRLGPRDQPTRPNLWDIARSEAANSKSQEWLNLAEDQAVNLRLVSATAKGASRAQTLATGLLLSSPTTSVMRNTLSGLASTWEILGTRRAIMPMIETAIKARNRMSAREIGAVRDNIGDFLHADKLGESFVDDVIRSVTDTALKYSGYNGSEVFVRSHGALAFSQFAKDAVEFLKNKPTSGRSKEALALFKRMDVDPAKIVAENADWKTGAETRRFIRTLIRDTQGGYKFDQVPLWANSNAGRFFYQFGRWGTQRARNIWRNGIKPALGEEVQWHGKTMIRYDARPLLRMAAGTVALGETFALVAAGLFDRDRRDASLTEIRSAWEMGDRQLSVSLALERALNDIVMAGTLGIWGQPIDFAKGLKDQSRFKNPAEPPSMSSVKAVVDMALSAYDQDGRLTRADLSDFATKIVPGAKQITDVARNIFDEPLYEAQNDLRTLRAAGMRWGRANLIDVAPRAKGEFRKSPLAPLYEPIKEALLVGDVSRAQTLKIDYLSDAPDAGAALKNLRASVKQSQPFRVGPYKSDEYKTGFYNWAAQNLSEQDFDQAWRVQERYVAAAEAAELWNAD